MKNIFITSMIRSGSTLLDKLLSNHADLHINSQPFPYLFINAKKLFYKEILHPEKYFVLNNYFLENCYTLNDLNKFLERNIFSSKEVIDLFKSMKNYSGQCTKIDDFKILYHSLQSNKLNCYHKAL